MHFILSVAGVIFALPAAFDGFSVAPGKTLLAWTAAVLLAPLAWLGVEIGYTAIAALSVVFGLVAVMLVRLVATRRAARRTRA